MTKEIVYPIRINKYLAYKGFVSRRKADDFIEKGNVHVNGKKAVLGQMIEEGDTVEVGKKIENFIENYRYFAVHKPRGVVSHNPQKDERGVKDVMDLPGDVTVLGRLDKDSEGLLIFTSDGRIVDRMLNPKYDHEKEYIVTVDKPITSSFLKKMEKGVDIEGYITKPAHAKIMGEKTFQLILTEGKKHQIRRMVTALGYEVRKLKRVRIMNIKLSNLKKGEKREIKGKERETLLNYLGL